MCFSVLDQYNIFIAYILMIYAKCMYTKILCMRIKIISAYSYLFRVVQNVFKINKYFNLFSTMLFYGRKYEI